MWILFMSEQELLFCIKIWTDCDLKKPVSHVSMFQKMWNLIGYKMDKRIVSYIAELR